MKLDPLEDKAWRFAFLGQRLDSITAASMGLKTLYMITRAFTTLIIASSRAQWTSFLATADPFMRSVYYVPYAWIMA